MVFVTLGTLSLIVVAFFAVIFPVAYDIIDDHLPTVPAPFTLLDTIRSGVVTLVLAAMLWAFHSWLPAHGKTRPALWPGILFTLVMWYLGSTLFSWYMSGVADYARYYAGLAGIVAALLFFYISSVILLFSGALNRALHEERMKRRVLRVLTSG